MLLDTIKDCNISYTVSSAVMANTHLRSSRRPLSPRWDRAGLSWIRAWRLACEPAQTKSMTTGRLDKQRPLSEKHHQLKIEKHRIWEKIKQNQEKIQMDFLRTYLSKNVWFFFFTAQGREECRPLVLLADSAPKCVFTLSSQASSSMSRASMDTALLWSCSCVTSSSMPQLLKNSTLARSSTRRCLVAYNLHGCSVRQRALWEKERMLGWYLQTLRCRNNAVIRSHFLTSCDTHPPYTRSPDKVFVFL